MKTQLSFGGFVAARSLSVTVSNHRTKMAGLVLIVLALTLSCSHAAALVGSFSTLPAGANVRLTSEGALDWVHWGFEGQENINRKAGVTPQIGAFAVIGEELVAGFDDNATGYTWTDGDPTPTANNATWGIYVVGQDNGFELTAPADTTARTLKLYVGAYDAGMRFEASLSDNSAPGYTNTAFRNVEDGPNAVFTLNYSAASAGQTLAIRFTVGENIGDGNVTLQAATLTLAAPVIELVRPVSDALFYPATSGIEFRGRTLAPRSLATNQLRLILNDADVSSQLTISGTETNRTATLPSLQANVLYNAQVIVTDDASRSSTNTFSFDTFDPAASIVIEAEDYNYGDGVCEEGVPNPASSTGGLYQNNPPASGFDTNDVQVGGLQTNGSRLGYVGAVGLPGVDFNDLSIEVGEDYRPCDPVLTGNSNTYFSDTAPDLQRARFVTAGVRDFVVAAWAPGDWLNYTRSFNGQYRAYLRAATQGDDRVIQLDRVTSSPTQPDQTTEILGTFPLVRSGLLLGLRTIPLLGTNGSPQTLTLNGVQTLRLTALDPADNVSVNYLVLVPAQTQTPPGPVLINAAAAAGNFSFSIQTAQNTTYAVEFRETLPTTPADAWQRLESIAGDGTLKSYSRAMATRTGFFRVVIVP